MTSISNWTFWEKSQLELVFLVSIFPSLIQIVFCFEISGIKYQEIKKELVMIGIFWEVIFQSIDSTYFSDSTVKKLLNIIQSNCKIIIS